MCKVSAWSPCARRCKGDHRILELRRQPFLGTLPDPDPALDRAPCRIPPMMVPRPRSAQGFTLIELMIVVALISIIAAIAIPNLLEGRKTANEASAIGSLRTLAAAQSMFRGGDKEADNLLDYASDLAELSNVGLVDNVVGAGSKSGYAFSLSGATYEWQCSATPLNENTGRRNFIVCTDGVIRFSTGGAADCSSTGVQ